MFGVCFGDVWNLERRLLWWQCVKRLFDTRPATDEQTPQTEGVGGFVGFRLDVELPGFNEPRCV